MAKFNILKPDEIKVLSANFLTEQKAFFICPVALAINYQNVKPRIEIPNTIVSDRISDDQKTSLFQVWQFLGAGSNVYALEHQSNAQEFYTQSFYICRSFLSLDEASQNSANLKLVLQSYKTGAIQGGFGANIFPNDCPPKYLWLDDNIIDAICTNFAIGQQKKIVPAILPAPQPVSFKEKSNGKNIALKIAVELEALISTSPLISSVSVVSEVTGEPKFTLFFEEEAKAGQFKQLLEKQYPGLYLGDVITEVSTATKQQTYSLDFKLSYFAFLPQDKFKDFINYAVPSIPVAPLAPQPSPNAVFRADAFSAAQPNTNAASLVKGKPTARFYYEPNFREQATDSPQAMSGLVIRDAAISVSDMDKHLRRIAVKMLTDMLNNSGQGFTSDEINVVINVAITSKINPKMSNMVSVSITPLAASANFQDPSQSAKLGALKTIDTTFRSSPQVKQRGATESVKETATKCLTGETPFKDIQIDAEIYLRADCTTPLNTEALNKEIVTNILPGLEGERISYIDEKKVSEPNKTAVVSGEAATSTPKPNPPPAPPATKGMFDLSYGIIARLLQEQIGNLVDESSSLQTLTKAKQLCSDDNFTAFKALSLSQRFSLITSVIQHDQTLQKDAQLLPKLSAAYDELVGLHDSERRTTAVATEVQILNAKFAAELEKFKNILDLDPEIKKLLLPVLETGLKKIKSMFLYTSCLSDQLRSPSARVLNSSNLSSNENELNSAIDMVGNIFCTQIIAKQLVTERTLVYTSVPIDRRSNLATLASRCTDEDVEYFQGLEVQTRCNLIDNIQNKYENLLPSLIAQYDTLVGQSKSSDEASIVENLYKEQLKKNILSQAGNAQSEDALKIVADKCNVWAILAQVSAVMFLRFRINSKDVAVQDKLSALRDEVIKKIVAEKDAAFAAASPPSSPEMAPAAVSHSNMSTTSLQEESIDDQLANLQSLMSVAPSSSPAAPSSDVSTVDDELAELELLELSQQEEELKPTGFQADVDKISNTLAKPLHERTLTNERFNRTLKTQLDDIKKYIRAKKNEITFNSTERYIIILEQLILKNTFNKKVKPENAGTEFEKLLKTGEMRTAWDNARDQIKTCVTTRVKQLALDAAFTKVTSLASQLKDGEEYSKAFREEYSKAFRREVLSQVGDSEAKGTDQEVLKQYNKLFSNQMITQKAENRLREYCDNNIPVAGTHNTHPAPAPASDLAPTSTSSTHAFSLKP